MASQVFADNFNRPDGPVGAGWTVVGGTPSIVGGQLAGSAVMAVRQTTPFSASNQAIQFLFITNPNVTSTSYFWIRADAGRLNGYRLAITTNASATQLTLDKLVAGSAVSLGYVRLQQGGDTPIDVVLGHYNGEVYLGIGGQEGLRATDVTVPANYSAYVNMPSAGCFVDNWASWDLASGLMVVTPTPPGVGETYWNLALSNDLPLWTPGTPGSPIFGVDAGTIISQEVTGPTSAIIVWEPPSVYHQVQIQDGDAGTFGAFIPQLFIDSGSGGGGGSGLPEAIVDWLVTLTTAVAPNLLISLINALAGNTPNGSDLLSKLYYGDPDYPGWRDFIAAWPLNMTLIHGNAPYNPEARTSIYELLLLANADIADTKSNLAALRDNNTHTLQSILDALPGADDRIAYILNELYAIRTPTNYHLGDVIGYLYDITAGGTIGLADIRSLLETMRGVDGPSLLQLKTYLDLLTSNGLYGLNDVAGWINSIKGDPARTISDVYAYLGTIRGEGTPTIHGLDDKLNDISAAIANIPTADLGAVLAAIAAQTVVLSAEHSAILAAIAGLAATEAADLVTTLAEIAGLAASLAELLAAINGLQNQPTAKAPPVYPGPAGVNFAAPIAFDTDGNFDVACDGVLVNVTQVGTSPWRVTSGNVTRYSRLGVLAMKSTDGYAEPIQPLQFLQQVVTPTTLLHCGGVMVQCKPGTTGTLTPWTLK